MYHSSVNCSTVGGLWVLSSLCSTGWAYKCPMACTQDFLQQPKVQRLDRRLHGSSPSGDYAKLSSQKIATACTPTRAEWECRDETFQTLKGPFPASLFIFLFPPHQSFFPHPHSSSTQLAPFFLSHKLVNCVSYLELRDLPFTRN